MAGVQGPKYHRFRTYFALFRANLWRPDASVLGRWRPGAHGHDRCLPDCQLAAKGASGARGTRGMLPSMLMLYCSRWWSSPESVSVGWAQASVSGISISQ